VSEALADRHPYRDPPFKKASTYRDIRHCYKYLYSVPRLVQQLTRLAVALHELRSPEQMK
jgi:hypothetical protein